ncbi:P-loop containing nucleoside triphosphate hydrolase protein, partial [Polychytrium aggregatum]|uniref:P-loop containing nucleoside triphosphate hydrolase protein n=1 Tax=Polychytrium aggregatum TaxID=110093 RepID=UPI0022FF099D
MMASWSEKKWVWVADKAEGYIAGSIVSVEGENATLDLTNGTKRTVNINETEKMNPPKFDRVEDMADLTYLNEASVVHNLRLRYSTNLIYTYSGLFLVAVNPYKKLPIYTDDVVRAYKGKKRSEMPPHIFATADMAYTDMLEDRENQSILITGESGAGKTENTKKVIQYLASIACSAHGSGSSGKALGTLEQQILQANPILEAFGNAQTIRNNNSSRFGKFIRIEFNSSGQIAGANIQRYLLEKSRVTHQTSKERNYHIFYQLLKGATPDIREKLLLDGGANDYAFTKESNKTIDGVDDVAEFKLLRDAMNIMNLSSEEHMDYFRVIASVLHLGNIQVAPDREDQAKLVESSQTVVEKICHVLGISVAEFTKGLLKPKVKAGREWVVQSRNCDQVMYSIEALARAIYERMFADLVDRINRSIETSASKTAFIGVLDIAGFEIFELNSFEQLCINYTNEKLQQFFNHHMFILEQEEYKRENIEWKFIDFGLDLQPTIDLIEKTSPIGILSCLDEECVMPKATDKTFIEKLHGLWKGKSSKYEVPRFNSAFILQHYAGKVEYTVTGWLDKNKDPLNENITKLLSTSSEKYIASLFSDYSGDAEEANPKARGVTKKGAFRTVAQKHKEQLASLMSQLYSTEPHFVRCIIPNEEKKAGKLDVNLVLEQLRCNGVLEGIRICRAGFPNRLVFADFRQRYEILTPGLIPKGTFMDGRQAAQILLDAQNLDKNQYRIGTTKIFFRAGVLAQMEELRDIKLSKIVAKIQAIMRGYLCRRYYKKRLDQLRAIRIIQRNARIYVTLREWSWWKLYTKVKPLLNVSRADEELRKKEEAAREWEERAKKEQDERAKIEAERARLEAEMKRIEDLLVQEKNAAGDQAEILARTQKREIDLTEELKDANAELDKKEALNDELSKTKKKLEGELRELKDALGEEKSTLERLEKDKLQKEQRIKELEADFQNENATTKKLEGDKRSLEAQISDILKQLEDSGASSAELLKAKAKMQANITELEQRLEQEAEEKAKLEQRKSSLEAELKTARDNIAELSQAKADLDATIKKKDNELASVNERLKQETTEKDGIEKQRRELQLKLNKAEEDLETERGEKDKLANQKKKLEKELAQLTSLVEEKGSEETKQGELRRLRENELNDLKIQLASVQNDLEENKRRSTQVIDKFKADLDAAQQEKDAIAKNKATLDKQLSTLKEELEQTEEERSKLEKSKRQLESDIQTAKSNVSEQDRAIAEYKAKVEALEKQVATLSARLEESEANLARVERDRAANQKQSESLKDDLEEEVKKRTTLEGQKKKLTVEMADLQARLQEEETAKLELQRRLTAKTAEFDSLNDRFSKDFQGRMAELEETKKKTERELAELLLKYEELDRSSANNEKTKSRLATEIEDLRLEIDREHTATRNAERQAKQIESQLAAVNISFENERRQRELAEASGRKLQSQLDSMQLELDEKNNNLSSLQRSKNDLEHELKSLIDEIGDGGKNIHELEKAKRRLETKIDEMQQRLDEEEAARKKVEEAKVTIENQLNDYRRKTEADLAAKDSQMEETRRMLLKEVNSLGEQLDETTAQRNEYLKAKKKLEEQIEGLSTKAESSAKGQSDLEKAKKKAESSLREKEKVKLDSKIEEMTKIYQSAVGQQEDLQNQIGSLLNQVRDLRSNVEELE